MSATVTEVTAPGVPLADAIGQVREQLILAMEAGKGSPLAFKPGPVQLELEITFTASIEGEGGVKAWVLSFTGKGQQAHGTTSRLTVTLNPIDRRTGKDVEINDY